MQSLCHQKRRFNEDYPQKDRERSDALLVIQSSKGTFICCKQDEQTTLINDCDYNYQIVV